MAQSRILIIEDEKPLVHALNLKLTSAGFAVTVAGNGQEGLKALTAKHFDVVLLDLVMPVMDGFQVLEQLHLKGKKGEPTVFVLSNLSQHKDEQRVLALGAKKFFIKSDISLTNLIEEIKAAMTTK